MKLRIPPDVFTNHPSHFTMLLRGLRPLRAATVTRIPSTPVFTRRIASASIGTNSSEPPVPPPQPQAPSATAATPAQAKAPATTTIPQQLPYLVTRNNLGNLAVYQRSDRGGSLKRTLIKRAEGDVAALSRDVAEGLKLPQTDVKINNVTRHIVLKVCWLSASSRALLRSWFPTVLVFDFGCLQKIADQCSGTCPGSGYRIPEGTRILRSLRIELVCSSAEAQILNQKI